MKQKVFCIIQARLGSTRLPGKVLKLIASKPVLWHLMENLKFSQKIYKFIIATSKNKQDNALVKICKKYHWNYFRGDENNVLDRYYQAARSLQAQEKDLIVRITADDIFHDPYFIDGAINLLQSLFPYCEHISNNRKFTLPYGFDFEIFSYKSLKNARHKAKSAFEQEHVTPYIRNASNKFPFISISNSRPLKQIHLSIDTIKDFNFNTQLYKKLKKLNKKRPFLYRDILEALKIKHN
jgi:spore coat polysaccharide biosynthesis protein SpsF